MFEKWETRSEKRENEKRTSPFNGPVAKLYREIRIFTFFISVLLLSLFVRSLSLALSLSLSISFSISFLVAFALPLILLWLIIQECLHKRTYVDKNPLYICWYRERGKEKERTEMEKNGSLLSVTIPITSAKMSGQKMWNSSAHEYMHLYAGSRNKRESWVPQARIRTAWNRRKLRPFIYRCILYSIFSLLFFFLLLLLLLFISSHFCSMHFANVCLRLYTRPRFLHFSIRLMSSELQLFVCCTYSAR